MAKKSTKSTIRDDDKPWEGRCCRECEHCNPYWRFETLTVRDRQPTMGVCPYIENRKVLLSEKACKEHFRLKRRCFNE